MLEVAASDIGNSSDDLKSSAIGATERPAMMAAAMRARGRRMKPGRRMRLYLENYAVTARRRRHAGKRASQARNFARRENAPEAVRCARRILSRARASHGDDMKETAATAAAATAAVIFAATLHSIHLWSTGVFHLSRTYSAPVKIAKRMRSSSS